MIVLPIKKKWFDMIKSGEKKEEYREIKPYWSTRFNNEVLLLASELTKKELEYLFISEEVQCTYVIFRNGYSKNSPQIKCKVKILVGYGKEEWGAEPNKLYYVLKILSVEKV